MFALISSSPSVPYGDYEDYNNQILEKDANEFANKKEKEILYKIKEADGRVREINILFNNKVIVR